jgi:hypothetical protein
MPKMGASLKAGAGAENGVVEGGTCEDGLIEETAEMGIDGSADAEVGTGADVEADADADGFVVMVMHSLILVTVVEVSPDDRS